MIVKILLSFILFILAILSFILAIFISRKKPYPDSLRYPYYPAKSERLETVDLPNSLPAIAGVMVVIIGICFLFIAVTTINPVIISHPLQELIKLKSITVYICLGILFFLLVIMGIEGFYRGVVKKDIYIGEFPVRFEGRQAFIWGLMIIILSLFGICVIILATLANL